MPTPKSKRYLCTLPISGSQPAQLHIFSTDRGGYSFKLSWQRLSPPSPQVESKTFGPYPFVSEGVLKVMFWHAKKFKAIIDYDYA